MLPIKRILIAALLGCGFGQSLIAGDTTTWKAPRHMAGLQLGLGGFLFSGDYIPQGQVYSSTATDRYNLRPKTCGSVFYDLRINRNTKKSLLFLGANAGYTDFELKHTLSDHFYEGPLISAPETDASQTVLTYDMNTVSFGLHISVYRFFKNFCIFNQFGINYSHIAGQQSGKSYRTTTTSSGYEQTPSGMWYSTSSTVTSTQTDMPYVFDDYIEPFFSSGIGFRTGHFLPFAGFSIANFGPYFDPAFKMEIGVKVVW